MQVDKK